MKTLLKRGGEDKVEVSKSSLKLLCRLCTSEHAPSSPFILVLRFVLVKSSQILCARGIEYALAVSSNIDIRVHVRDWKRPNARDRVAY